MFLLGHRMAPLQPGWVEQLGLSHAWRQMTTHTHRVVVPRPGADLVFIVERWHDYVFGANLNRAIASSFQECVHDSRMRIIRGNVY
jgi:hypothetical protein